MFTYEKLKNLNNLTILIHDKENDITLKLIDAYGQNGDIYISLKDNKFFNLHPISSSLCHNEKCINISKDEIIYNTFDKFYNEIQNLNLSEQNIIISDDLPTEESTRLLVSKIDDEINLKITTISNERSARNNIRLCRSGARNSMITLKVFELITDLNNDIQIENDINSISPNS